MKESSGIPEIQQKSPEEYVQLALKLIKDATGLDTTPEQEAQILMEVGKLCVKSGNWEQALESFQEALGISREEGVGAEAFKQIGHIMSRRSQWELALEAYNNGLEIFTEMGKAGEIGNIHNSIGFVYFQTGQMSKAKEYYDKALINANEYNDSQLLADVSNNLGILSNVLGCPNESINYFHQSIKGYKAIFDLAGLAQAHHNMAMAYMAKEEWKLAGENFQKATNFCLDAEDITLLSIIHTNRAIHGLNMHDPYMARIYCDKAFEIFTELDNQMGIAETHKIYGMIYSQMYNWDLAEKSFIMGIKVCEEYDNPLAKAEICYETAHMKREQNRKEEALKYFQESLNIYGSLGINNKVEKISTDMQEMSN